MKQPLLVFMGVPQLNNKDNFADYHLKLKQRTAKLPSTVFVLAAPDFSFSEIFTG